MHKKAIFLAIIIFLIAIFFRFWMLESVPPGLYPDEAMNGSNALYALKTGQYHAFYPENNGREGLFMNIIAASLWSFGNEPWAIRLISAIFGSLTVLGLFYFGREFFRGYEREKEKRMWGLAANEIIALSASFFLAVSFWHINFSRIGFRAIMAPLFLVWSLYFLWLVFRPDLSENKKILSVSFSGIIFGLGAHSYIAYRIAPVLLLIPFFIIVKNKIGYKYIFIFLFLALAAFAPLGIYYLQNPSDFLGRTSQVSVFSEPSPLKSFLTNSVKTAGSFWILGDLNPRHNFPARPLLWWPVGILFALGLIFTLTKNRKRLCVKFLWLWIFIFALPAVLSSEGSPHALRSILMLPAVMYIGAIGFWEILRLLDKRFVILLFVFLAAHTAITYSDYFWRWANLPATRAAFDSDYVDIGRWLNRQPPDIKKYVLINADGVLVSSPDNPKSRMIPMPSQTIMFLTGTWPEEERAKKNIYYVLEQNLAEADCSSACVIAPLKGGAGIKTFVETAVGLKLEFSVKPGFGVFYKGFDI